MLNYPTLQILNRQQNQLLINYWLHEKMHPKFSSKGKNFVNPRKKVLVLIGDSTIDNYIWVKEGKSVPACLARRLPGYSIVDLSCDGFTSHDVRYGAYRDKAVKSTKHTHTKFKPLNDKRIKIAEGILASFGGNDFREFLPVAATLRNPQDLLNGFNKVVKDLKENYIAVYKELRAKNPHAKIILMKQYYPSKVQNTYQIYEFMSKLGATLMGSEFKDSNKTIERIMELLYKDIFNNIHKLDKNFVILDPLLNPYDPKSHVSQIEPSAQSSEMLVEMIAYLIEMRVAPEIIYQFLLEFYTADSEKRHEFVKESSIAEWKPFPVDGFQKPKTLTSTTAQLAKKMDIKPGATPEVNIEIKEEKTPFLDLLKNKLMTHKIPEILTDYVIDFKKDNGLKLIERAKLIEQLENNILQFAHNPDAFLFYQIAYSYAREAGISHQKCYDFFMKITEIPQEKWSSVLDLLKESRKSYSQGDTTILEQIKASIEQGELTESISSKIYPKTSSCLVM